MTNIEDDLETGSCAEILLIPRSTHIYEHLSKKCSHDTIGDMLDQICGNIGIDPIGLAISARTKEIKELYSVFFRNGLDANKFTNHVNSNGFMPFSAHPRGLDNIGQYN